MMTNSLCLRNLRIKARLEKLQGELESFWEFSEDLPIEDHLYALMCIHFFKGVAYNTDSLVVSLCRKLGQAYPEPSCVGLDLIGTPSFIFNNVRWWDANLIAYESGPFCEVVLEAINNAHTTGD